MIIETIDIHQEEKTWPGTIRWWWISVLMKKISKSEGQDEDSAKAEVVDVTKEWMESMRCIDNVQCDFQGPTIYIQRVTSSQDPQLAVGSSPGQCFLNVLQE